jgi:hypothetical protein
LGGETEKLEPDLNQLGGTQTANRLVFTIGKYSVVDIFETNTYAHDPRNDFFNWSIIVVTIAVRTIVPDYAVPYQFVQNEGVNRSCCGSKTLLL